MQPVPVVPGRRAQKRDGQHLADRRKAAAPCRALANKLSPEERARILTLCNQPAYQSLPPSQIGLRLADTYRRRVSGCVASCGGTTRRIVTARSATSPWVSVTAARTKPFWPTRSAFTRPPRQWVRNASRAKARTGRRLVRYG